MGPVQEGDQVPLGCQYRGPTEAQKTKPQLSVIFQSKRHRPGQCELCDGSALMASIAKNHESQNTKMLGQENELCVSEHPIEYPPLVLGLAEASWRGISHILPWPQMVSSWTLCSIRTQQFNSKSSMKIVVTTSLSPKHKPCTQDLSLKAHPKLVGYYHNTFILYSETQGVLQNGPRSLLLRKNLI